MPAATAFPSDVASLTVKGVGGLLVVERVIGLLRQRRYPVRSLDVRLATSGASEGWVLRGELEPVDRLELLLDRLHRLPSVTDVVMSPGLVLTSPQRCRET
ncbi:hypothetical protein [Cryptosporangium sp. NPDC048952]|uniref:hypothetical protein n=1 Tax=Cryptosporangium sp. NPDC048952 TaxID=3363961 RepID=UPI00371971F9